MQGAGPGADDVEPPPGAVEVDSVERSAGDLQPSLYPGASVGAAEDTTTEQDEQGGHDELARRVATALLAGLTALGCGGPSPAGCRVLRERPAPIVARERAAVRWVPTRAAPSYPVLDARIAGHGAWMVLDTGANQHALERGAGFWLGLSAPRGTVGATDAVGLAVRLVSYGEVPVALGLRGVPPRLPLYGFLEGSILDSGAAGLLSPQRLAPEGGHLEMDLRAGFARVVPEGEPSGPLALQPTCRSDDGVPLFVVDATIDGLEGFFVVDTGSDRTSVLLEGRFVDRFDERRRPGRLVATLGALERVDEVPGVTVELDGWRGEVVVDAVGPAPGRCPSDGTLGSDVLRHCALRISRRGGAIDCRPSVTASTPRSATSSSATGS